MEKYLKIIVIVGVVVILVFGYLIINMMLEDKNANQPATTEDTSEVVYNVEDYVITQSTKLYTDIGAKIGDNSRILATLESVTVENDQVATLNITDANNSIYELAICDMKLISLDYNGIDEVNMVYRTGGVARAIVGSYLYMYKTPDDSWSLDERAQHGGETEKTAATITDFEFAPMAQQRGHILLSYVVMDNGNGQEIKLPLSAMNVQSIVSNGEMTIYYANEEENPYKVRTGNDFNVNVTMTDDSVMIFAKGGQVNVQKSSAKGYWELEKTVDATRHQALITDIIFDFDKDNITGINYLVLTLADGSQEKMTLHHTQALYGTPYGNYIRTYASSGNDVAISDVDPADDWKMELNYDKGITLELRVGSNVWISKNNDDIYVLDYEYTHFMIESEKED